MQLDGIDGDGDHQAFRDECERGVETGVERRGMEVEGGGVFGHRDFGGGERWCGGDSESGAASTPAAAPRNTQRRVSMELSIGCAALATTSTGCHASVGSRY